MSNDHIDPNIDAPEVDLEQSPESVIPEDPNANVISGSKLTGDINSINRPKPPSPEKMKAYLDALVGKPNDESEVFAMAVNNIPDYATMDAEKDQVEDIPTVETDPEQDPYPTSLPDTDLDDDPRFDTETPMHDPESISEVMQTTTMNKEDLLVPTKKTISVAVKKESTPMMEETTVSPIESVETVETVETNTLDNIDTIVEEIEELTPVVETVEPVSISTPSVSLNIPKVTVTETVPSVEESPVAETETPTVESTTTEQAATAVAQITGDDKAGDDFLAALEELPTVVKDEPTDDLVTVDSTEVQKENEEEKQEEVLNIEDAFDLVTETTGAMIFEREFEIAPDLREMAATYTEDNAGALVIPLMNMDELNELYIQTSPQLLEATNKQMFDETAPNIRQELTQKNLKMRNTISDPTSYLYRLHAAREFFSTENSEFQRDILRTAFSSFKEKSGKDLAMSRAVNVKDKETQETVLVDDKTSDKDKLLAKLSDNSVVKGSVAFKTAALLINGLRKINLYNSGFFVVLSAPRMDTLTKYANKVRTNAGDYGRIMGKLSFLPAGVEVRAALFDLIEEIVVDSNLVDWEKPGVLRSAISSLDYNTLIWGAASLMYPRGVEIEYVCRNVLEEPKTDKDQPKYCHRVERTKVDVASMRYNNWSILNAEAIMFVDSRKPRTVAEAKAYREKYLGDVETTYEISSTPDGVWMAHLSIPTISEAEEAQRAYVSELLTVVQTDRPAEVNQYIRSKYLNSFVPYVRKLTYVDNATKKKIVFKEASALSDALDNLQLAPDITLGDKIVDFIAEKTVTHICFAHHPCPNCGKYPSDATNRLIACDPEFAFFQWAIFLLP